MAVPAAAGPLSAYPPAGLDRRFYAFALDRLTAWSVVGGVAWAAYALLVSRGGIGGALLVVLGALLLVGLVFGVLLGTAGTSPGKAALGLRVVDATTVTPIGVPRALQRTLILGVATLPTFGLGAATLAWTAVMDPGGRRRGWHDLVTESVVIDARPVPVAPEVEEPVPHTVVNLTAMRLMPSASTPPEAPLVPGRHAPQIDRWRVSFDTGESFVVEGLALVGRRPEPRAGEQVRHVVPLRSEDMSLSKTHAQVQVAPDGLLVVTDRGSTNGSVLIRGRLAKDLPAGKPTTLLPGDQVAFGDRRMTVARET